jgi:hypothetical protein
MFLPLPVFVVQSRELIVSGRVIIYHSPLWSFTSAKPGACGKKKSHLHPLHHVNVILTSKSSAWTYGAVRLRASAHGGAGHTWLTDKFRWKDGLLGRMICPEEVFARRKYLSEERRVFKREVFARRKDLLGRKGGTEEGSVRGQGVGS